MGALMEKLFGPGATPLVEIDTSGACESECCDSVEVISSSSSEPQSGVTHASAHAVTDSYNTIPDIENVSHIPCSSGTYAVVQGPYQTCGRMPGMKL